MTCNKMSRQPRIVVIVRYALSEHNGLRAGSSVNHCDVGRF